MRDPVWWNAGFITHTPPAGWHVLGISVIWYNLTPQILRQWSGMQCGSISHDPVVHFLGDSSWDQQDWGVASGRWHHCFLSFHINAWELKLQYNFFLMLISPEGSQSPGREDCPSTWPLGTGVGPPPLLPWRLYFHSFKKYYIVLKVCMGILSVCVHVGAWCLWRHLGLELQMGEPLCYPMSSVNVPGVQILFTQLLISSPSLFICYWGHC